MNAIPTARTLPVPHPPLPVPFVDPLDDDLPTDDVIVTTRRGICRVALVATEAGSRFQREGVAHDPMAWMLAPRRLFGGAPAIDACLDRDACLRGVLLHGLSLGVDAEAGEMDALSADHGSGAGRHEASDGEDGAEDRADGSDWAPSPGSISDGARLFTATVVSHDGFETVHAFHASIATEEAEVAGRLYCRIGAASAGARIVDGFDAADPLVAALVSAAMCDTLALVAADPDSPLAAGIDINIEQRFLT